MTPEQIKASIRQSFEEFNERNLTAQLERNTPNLVVHNLATGVEIKGLEAYQKSQDALIESFPDLHRTIEDIIVEGDKAFVRQTYTGTHKGKLGATAGNLAATGRKLSWGGFGVLRYEGNKVAETWIMQNRLSFYQQLGVTPTPDMK